MKKLLALIALGAAFYYTQAKTFLKEYKVKFFNAKLNGKKTREYAYSRIFFTVKMMVMNNTGFEGTLQSGYITVSYKGKVVGATEVKEPIAIKQKETVLQIPASLDSLKLIGSLPEMFSLLTTARELKFHLDGELKFAIGTYRVNTDYKVEI